jgi:hypothetical protein
MPRGRSTFTKRQKEYTRQQRQRDKAERKNKRKQEKAVEGSVAEVAELQQHAAAQAALLNVGREEADTMEESTSGARVGSDS